MICNRRFLRKSLFQRRPPACCYFGYSATARHRSAHTAVTVETHAVETPSALKSHQTTQLRDEIGSRKEKGKEEEALYPVAITPAITTYPPPHVTHYKPIPALTLARLTKVYAELSKARLTTLMVLTTMSGVALSPLPATVPVLLATAIGTTLCSASANTLNQIVESTFDAQMTRTRNRPMVRRIITPLHAAGFAAATGLAGPAILLAFTNPLTAGLGAFNIFLYAGVYTPLKRISVVNTWVGAVVGGIPPLMGWTACGNHILSASHPIQYFPPPILSEIISSSSILLSASASQIAEAVDNPLSPLVLFLLLFSWQFPHFDPLAHMVRTSYAQGGYRMMAVINPSKNALIAVRHSVALIGICSVLTPLAGLTTWAFAMTSMVPNALLLRSALKFWRNTTDKNARKLFHDSLWWLPVILGLMMFHKQGISWLEWIGWEESSRKEEPVEVLKVEA
ncbi:Protoheme IX farnesyltransferase, mitochondrial [Tulasnella sp. 330]|nr:Protoheme IX farnesyltransferase, mitochondrial [Tulasnella sp. 330]KAG8886374.1 Protoheme IX farnesyltransferase, mitochondrial [Tulasnella sp. 331]KAG8890755.1 Protoheme IX farnesyltransferase, mitochondrial [Tulasnella sp. 332]